MNHITSPRIGCSFSNGILATLALFLPSLVSADEAFFANIPAAQIDASIPVEYESFVDVHGHFKILEKVHSRSLHTTASSRSAALEQKAIRVHGTAKDASGKPIGNALILIVDDFSQIRRQIWDVIPGSRRPIDPVLATTRTGPDGAFSCNVALPERLKQLSAEDHYGETPEPGCSWLVIASTDQHGFDFQLTDIRPVDQDSETSIAIQGEWMAETDFDLVLDQAGEFSGAYATPNGQAIANGQVHLERINWRPSYFESRTLWTPRLTIMPSVRTGPDGRFRYRGLPAGFLAEVRLHSDGFEESRVHYPTSEGVTIAKRLRGNSSTRLQSPSATVIADPGIPVTGRVIDYQGLPIAHAKISFEHLNKKATTDHAGQYTFRVSHDFRDGRVRTASPCLLVAEFEQFGLPYTTTREIEWKPDTERIEFDFRMEALGKVTGRVVDTNAKPVSGATIRSLQADKMHAVTDSAGIYSLVLPVGRHRLAAGGNDRQFRWPKVRTLLRQRDPNLGAHYPGLDFDVVFGPKNQAAPIVVEPIETMTVYLRLPDGLPAAGAVARIFEPLTVFRRVQHPEAGDVHVRIGEPIRLGADGSLSVTPDDDWERETMVHVGMHQNGKSFFATAPLEMLDDGPTRLTLSHGCLTTGRITLDGRPLPGAQFTIRDVRVSEPLPKGRPQIIFGDGFRVESDQDGRYSLVLPRGGNYVVFAKDLPNDLGSLGINRGGLQNDGVRYEFPDLELFRGKAQIAGRLLDPTGEPLSGYEVSVDFSHSQRLNGIDDYQLIGYDDLSQFETDKDGRFAIRGLVENTYSVRVRTPEGPDGRQTIHQENLRTSSKSVEIKVQPMRPFGLSK